MPGIIGRADGRSVFAAVIAVALSTTVGCGTSYVVVRSYDGRVVVERYIAPEAYAAFLAGVLAEESGDFAGALAHYERARKEDDDPEIFARIGRVRCRLERKGSKAGEAGEAFAEGARLDGEYAGTSIAASQCALERGDARNAIAEARNAARRDPTNVEASALLVRALARTGDVEGRRRALELTSRHERHPAAWEALVAWSRSRDRELYARAIVGLLESDPRRLEDAEAAAKDLLGGGASALAHRVAAAIAETKAEHGGRGPRDALVARLAIDEALARNDGEAAVRRATRGHVAHSEVAARALVLERRDLALELARSVVAADPEDLGARMVLASLDTAAEARVRRNEPAPALCAFVLAARIAATSDSDVARRWLESIARHRFPAGDPLASSLAVDLAARNAFSVDALDANERLELSARRGEAPSAVAGTLDQKHALLFAAMTKPTAGPTLASAATFVDATDHDPVVAAAFARIALANVRGAAAMSERVHRAATHLPGDPLALAAAIELDRHAGRPNVAARARLFAVGRTPAERALATE